MAFSAGTFSLYSPGNPVVTGTTIASTWANNTLNDIATGLSTCVLKDGSQTITANLPMAGFKLTGLGAGTASTDSASINNVVNGTGALLTGVAGTNTITAGALSSFAYTSGQRVALIPANTITGAATLNITPSGGSALGAKNIFWNGAACSGNELTQSVPAILEYDGTQFNIIGPIIGTRLTNSLSGSVTMNNASNYFDGPTVAQGTVGTWFVSGTVTVSESGTSGNYFAKLWDGTTTIAGTQQVNSTAGLVTTIALSGYITSPAANLRISVRDSGGTTGSILFNQTGTSKDSTISAIRIG